VGEGLLGPFPTCSGPVPSPKTGSETGEGWAERTGWQPAQSASQASQVDKPAPAPAPVTAVNPGLDGQLWHVQMKH